MPTLKKIRTYINSYESFPGVAVASLKNVTVSLIGNNSSVTTGYLYPTLKKIGVVSSGIVIINMMLEPILLTLSSSANSTDSPLFIKSQPIPNIKKILINDMSNYSDD